MQSGVPPRPPQRLTLRHRRLHPLLGRRRGSIWRGGKRWLVLRRQTHPSPHRCRPPNLPSIVRQAADLAVGMDAAVEAGAATTAGSGKTRLWTRKICRGATGMRPRSSLMRRFRRPRPAWKIFFEALSSLGRQRHRRRWRLSLLRRHQRLALDTMGAVGSVRSISSSSVSNVLLPLIMTRSAPRSHRDSVARRLRVARRV